MICLIDETTDTATISNMLSNAAQKAYDKIKKLILKIFSLFKKNSIQKNLKEDFYDSYIDFARKLDREGYCMESNSYMAICEMYYQLMDRPKELISHEGFFMDLFNAFDNLLFARVNESEKYLEKYREFLIYRGKMQDYFYSELAIPSPYYDNDVCRQIIGHLAG